MKCHLWMVADEVSLFESSLMKSPFCKEVDKKNYFHFCARNICYIYIHHSLWMCISYGLFCPVPWLVNFATQLILMSTKWCQKSSVCVFLLLNASIPLISISFMRRLNSRSSSHNQPCELGDLILKQNQPFDSTQPFRIGLFTYHLLGWRFCCNKYFLTMPHLHLQFLINFECFDRSFAWFLLMVVWRQANKTFAISAIFSLNQANEDKYCKFLDINMQEFSQCLGILNSSNAQCSDYSRSLHQFLWSLDQKFSPFLNLKFVSQVE